ncbi:MAG: sulfotransferase [Pseudomonadota bacterium]|nr:sulfotransferase [Pseudomonadota bacterium]
MTRKIFGIGLNKTGTSSLGAAGGLLGLRCKTWDRRLFQNAIVDGERELLWETIDRYDVFEDFPYPLLYEEIDARYPGSAFILTRRSDPQAWLRSLKAHAMRARPSSRTHKIVYGFQYPHGREQAFLDFYERHNEKARRYFAARPADFLEIAWEEEKDWRRLCGFLGAAAPDAPLPRANASASKGVNPLYYAYHAVARLLEARARP